MNTTQPLSSLAHFFSPKGIALIGATNDPTKLGYGLARNLVGGHYQGMVYFVNPKGGRLLGRPIYPEIRLVPDPLDLVILLIQAQAVPTALRECGERGLRAAVLASGGFRETGPEGAALEAECLAAAKQYGIRLLGPNCVGLIDTHMPLNATFLSPPGPMPGDVAFLSHSGAICSAVLDWARGQGFGLSRLISLGNQVDINETDLLEPIADDPFTRVLALYLEGVSDGRRFVQEASRIARRKPVIALKVGRFSSGQRAVASHTGALAGQDHAFSAAFRRAGVIRAETTEEMFEWARALAWAPLPKGRAMAILTDAGGPGACASDALEANGLWLAELSAETRRELGALLPPAASLQNPVDMLASASPQQYAACLSSLLADDQVCGALVILVPPPMHTAGAVAKALIPVIHSAEKPVVIALMGERLILEAVEYLRAACVPDYRFPERAVSALAILAQRAEFLAQENGTPAGSSEPLTQGLLTQDEAGIKQARVQRILLEERLRFRPERHPEKKTWLSQAAVQGILETYLIRCPPIRLACSPEEAGRLASEMRTGAKPAAVALKVVSPDLPHKSEVGGILLDLQGETAVARGYETILQNVRQSQPGAEILGIQIQAMVPDGQEVIIGAVQDPQFGPLLMFGSGGIEVEGLKDVTFELAPLSRAQAEEMLERTWAGRRLRGFRSLPPADREAVLDVLVSLAQMVLDFPEFCEIEINPLRVLAQGCGAYAIDARIRAAF